MENTAYYVDYYIDWRLIGYSHEASMLATIEFMDKQLPAVRDIQMSIARDTVIRVIYKIARIIDEKGSVK